MGLRFSVLGSSSSGNSALLSTANCNVLIDVGFTAKKLAILLAEKGFSLDTIDGIFITHEHTDHTSGLLGIAGKCDIPVFANRDTSEAIQSRLKKSIHWHIFETGAQFTFKDFQVTTFSIPHDAQDPVGYIFRCQSENENAHRSLAWVTDLGHVTQLVRQKIQDVDILVIESNHDLQRLQADTKRPWSVKQRILGRHGHLSNATTHELLHSIEAPQWKKVFLAHLSKDCNDVALVEQLFSSLKEKYCIDITVISPEVDGVTLT